MICSMESISEEGLFMLGASNGEKVSKELNQEKTLQGIFVAYTECQGNVILMYHIRVDPGNTKKSRIIFRSNLQFLTIRLSYGPYYL